MNRRAGYEEGCPETRGGTNADVVGNQGSRSIEVAVTSAQITAGNGGQATGTWSYKGEWGGFPKSILYE